MRALEQYAAFKRKRCEKKPAPAGCDSPASLAQWRERMAKTGAALDEFEGRKLLADYGIPGPREAVAKDEEAAVNNAGQIGYPVVLKILSPDIQHKTEAGGVRVGLKDETAVRYAFREIMESARKYKPEARLEGVLIQEMIPSDAVEVILGIVQDINFGPVLVFGSGGILVELIKDSAVQLPPLNRDNAIDLIHQIRGKKLLMGYRGRPAADIDALAEALVRLSQLAVDLGDRISALDINPLMVLPAGKGVRAVDVLVEFK
jgi:acyl-CoA synthetase (NDP forming)